MLRRIEPSLASLRRTMAMAWSEKVAVNGAEMVAARNGGWPGAAAV